MWDSLFHSTGLSRCRFPVRRRPREMDQPKRIVHLKKGFGVSQKEVATRQQIRIKVLHYTALRSEVKVDENVAAEDQIHPFLEQHLIVVTKIDPIKADLRLEQIVGLEFLVACIFEIFPAHFFTRTAQRILSVNSGARRFE